MNCVDFSVHNDLHFSMFLRDEHGIFFSCPNVYCQIVANLLEFDNRKYNTERMRH